MAGSPPHLKLPVISAAERDRRKEKTVKRRRGGEAGRANRETPILFLVWSENLFSALRILEYNEEES